MRTRTAVILTCAWMLAVVGIGAFGLWYVMENPIRGVSREKRAQMMGSGLGTLSGIGLGIIWAVWLVRRKRAQQAASRTGKSERHRR